MKPFLFTLPSILLIVFTGFQSSASSEEALTPSNTLLPVDGVWQIIEASYVQGGELKWRNYDRIQPNLIQFQGEFYSFTAIDSGQPRPSMEESSTLENIPEETFRAIVLPYRSHAGNYELAGSTLIMRPLVALQTNMEGVSMAWEYKMEDGRLLISQTNPYGQGGVVTLILERLS